MLSCSMSCCLGTGKLIPEVQLGLLHAAVLLLVCLHSLCRIAVLLLMCAELRLEAICTHLYVQFAPWHASIETISPDDRYVLLSGGA